MIDLQLLREKPDYVAHKISVKDPEFDIKKLIELDKEVRSIQQKVEALRAEKNELAQRGKSGVTEEIKERSKAVSGLIKELEIALKTTEEAFKDLYLHCPNMPLDDVPVGNKESNAVVKTVGTKPAFTFTPQNHADLAEKLGWIDFKSAAAMSGSQFALYRDTCVDLMYALAMFFYQNNKSFGYRPVLPPYLINENALIGASNFPRFKDNVYAVEADKLFLTPTAEVNLANLYRDRIFLADELPIRMTAWTSCFRREAGGYGATERGLIRIHQFEKVELYTICTPDKGNEEQERMIACAESILQKLGLHYQISLLAGQDCSFASAKTYDIEVWMPGQKEYKEVSSVSNCSDFQARRCGIRYRKSQGDKTQLAYTLNGSSLALPRVMVALLETYQQADGSIALPDVLKHITLTL